MLERMAKAKKCAPWKNEHLRETAIAVARFKAIEAGMAASVFAKQWCDVNCKPHAEDDGDCS